MGKCIGRVVLVMLALLAAGWGMAAPALLEDAGRIRALAREIEGVMATPTDAGVGHIYHDVYPAFAEPFNFALNMRELHPDPRAMTLTRYTDAMLAAGLNAELVWHLRRCCLELFHDHPAAIAPEIHSILRGNDVTAQKKAISFIQSAELTAFTDDLIALFKRAPDANQEYGLRDFIANVIARSGDARVIPLLMSDVKRPLRYMQDMYVACRNRPAPAAIVALLSAREASVRWQACYVLSSTRDPALVPHVLRLAKDVDPQVREYAAMMAFNLPAEAFARVRPAMVVLLSDPVFTTAARVVILFAARQGDPVCKPALLRLLRENQDDGQGLIRQLVDMAGRLTGTPLVVTYTHEGRLEDTVQNREALAAFARTVPGADLSLFLPRLPDAAAARRRATGFLRAVDWTPGTGAKADITPPAPDAAWGNDVWTVQYPGMRLVLDRYSGLVRLAQGEPSTYAYGAPLTEHSAEIAARSLLITAGLTGGEGEYWLEANAPAADGTWQVRFRRFLRHYAFREDTAVVSFDAHSGRLHELIIAQPSPRPASLESLSNKEQAITSALNFMGAQGWHAGKAKPLSATLQIVRPDNTWAVRAGKAKSLQYDYQHPRLAWVVVFDAPWQHTELWYTTGYGIIGGRYSGPLTKGSTVDEPE